MKNSNNDSDIILEYGRRVSDLFNSELRNSKNIFNFIDNTNNLSVSNNSTGLKNNMISKLRFFEQKFTELNKDYINFILKYVDIDKELNDLRIKCNKLFSEVYNRENPELYSDSLFDDYCTELNNLFVELKDAIGMNVNSVYGKFEKYRIFSELYNKIVEIGERISTDRQKKIGTLK